MIGCESMNLNQKDMCWIEIGLRAQIVLIILDARVDIKGGIYVII